MPQLDRFRSFDIAQTRDGKVWELDRHGDSVTCVAFDTQRECFAELCAVGGIDVNDEEAARLFNERAEIMLGLRHSSWSRLFDFGVDDAVFYYAYEFCDGERLGEYLKRSGTIEEGIFGELLQGVASGLAAIAESTVSLDEIDLRRVRVHSVDGERLVVQFGCVPLCQKEDVLAPFVPIRGRQAISAILDLFDHSASSLRVWDKVVRIASASDSLAEFSDTVNAIEIPVDGGFFQPRRLLESRLYRKRNPVEFLEKGYEIAKRGGGNFTYELKADGTAGGKLRLIVLPPDRWIQSRFLSMQNGRQPVSALPVRKEWVSDDYRVVVEDRFTSLSVDRVLRDPGGLEASDASALLQRIHEAVREIESRGIDIPDFRPKNIYLCFDEEGVEVDTEAIAGHRPLTTWPPFTVRIRTHRTMEGLLRPPDVDDPERMRNVLSKYLCLRSLGMRDRADALLENGEVSAREANIATARQILEELEGGDDSEDEPTEPLWDYAGDEEGEMDAETGLNDGEMDFEEEDLYFVSPIAVAMGVEVEEGDLIAPGPGIEGEESIFSHLDEKKPKKKESGFGAYILSFLVGMSLAAYVIYKFAGWRALLD